MWPLGNRRAPSVPQTDFFTCQYGCKTSEFWKLSSEYSERNINASRFVAQPVPDFSKGHSTGDSWEMTCDVLQLHTMPFHWAVHRGGEA